MRETQAQSQDWEDPLEKEMATFSSTLAWKIPWTEERGRLPSMGSQSWTRLSDFTFTFCFIKRKKLTSSPPSYQSCEEQGKTEMAADQRRLRCDDSVRPCTGFWNSKKRDVRVKTGEIQIKSGVLVKSHVREPPLWSSG